MLVRCVGSLDTETLRNLDSNKDLLQVIEFIQESLSYQYHASWSLSLQVISSLFDVLGKSFTTQLSKVGVMDIGLYSV